MINDILQLIAFKKNYHSIGHSWFKDGNFYTVDIGKSKFNNLSLGSDVHKLLKQFQENGCALCTDYLGLPQ